MAEPARPSAAATPPAMANGQDLAALRAESNLGIRRFLQANSVLITTGSLVFATAAFLRASPKDNAVAVLMCLLLVMGLTIFLRLWSDLPRELVVLPGANWTLGLTVLYYCMTIALIVGEAYLLAGLVEQRHTYLPEVLGTGLAISGAAALTHRAAAARRIASGLTRLFGAARPERVAQIIVAGLLVVTVAGAFVLAGGVSPLINAGLDRVVGSPDAPR